MAEFSLPHDHGACLTEASLKCQLDKPQTFQAVADLFKLLDDPSRVRIFWLLGVHRGSGDPGADREAA